MFNHVVETVKMLGNSGQEYAFPARLHEKLLNLTRPEITAWTEMQLTGMFMLHGIKHLQPRSLIICMDRMDNKWCSSLDAVQQASKPVW